MSIFVSIPSYRDPELPPTLADCFAKARWPADVHIGVCWQHDPTETLGALADDPRVRVVDVPYRQSRGLGWARSQCATRYDGESFVLHLDSHHRFVEGWDARLIDMLGRTGAAKPILTTYPPAYDPATGSVEHETRRMQFVRFTEEGTILMEPFPIALAYPFEPWPTEIEGPVPSRFLAGGFSFSVGRFLEEVPPDPEMYFAEETCWCARAFTHGYDLFHPDEVICWHQYARRGLPRHWEDHASATPRPHELASRGKARFRALFQLDAATPPLDLGAYGLGRERTLRDYQRYAGVCHRTQRIEVHALRGQAPPGPAHDADDATWEASLLETHRREVVLDGRRLPASFDEVPRWTLVLTRAGEALTQRTFTTAEMNVLRSRDASKLRIQYLSRGEATGWSVSLSPMPDVPPSLLLVTIDEATPSTPVRDPGPFVAVVRTCEGVTLDVRTPARLAARVASLMPHGAQPALVKDGPHVTLAIRERPEPDANLELRGDTTSWRGHDVESLLRHLRAELQLAVALHAPARLFVHAGVVAWRGRAIIVPGSSGAGKTSLVTELLSLGCEYYSDEFAVLDAAGQVHPYARSLRVRREPGSPHSGTFEPTDLGFAVGTRPIPIGLVVVTRYVPGAHFVPTRLTRAEAFLQLLDHSVSVRRTPERALDWIERALDDAEACGGIRGEAAGTAARILEVALETTGCAERAPVAETLVSGSRRRDA